MRESSVGMGPAFRQTNLIRVESMISRSREVLGRLWVWSNLCGGDGGFTSSGKSYIVKMIIRFLTWTGLCAKCSMLDPIGGIRHAGADSVFSAMMTRRRAK